MSKVVAVANQKGGVGKTTVTVNFGLKLADQGLKVLFFDFDPQNNLGKTLAKEFCSRDEYKKGDCKANAINMFEEVITPEPHQVAENVFLLGAHKKMSSITQDMIFNMADSLDNIANDFDIVLIDCPPAVGPLQHAALAIANGLLVVSQLESMSLDGVDEIMTTVRQVKRKMNKDLEVLGIVINLASSRKINDQVKVEKELRENYGSLVFEPKLIANTATTEAMSKGKALFQYSKRNFQHFGFEAGTLEFEQRLANIGEY